MMIPHYIESVCRLKKAIIFVFTLVLLWVPDGISGKTGIIQDEVPDKRQNTLQAAESDTNLSASTSNEVEKIERIFQLRNSERQRLAPELEEEERMAGSVVQAMDRESAAQWMATFISSKPWNCPVKLQRQWIEAIIQAAEKNRLPISKEILGLTACIISIESGFRADPLAVDVSRGEDITALLDRAEKELFAKFGTLMSIPPIPQIYAAYKDRYYPRLQACKTEGEIEHVARELADELRKDASRFPSIVRAVVDKELEKLVMVVRTKGSMQLNFSRAKDVMRERGEQFTDRELCDYMYTLNGGVDVGVAALKPMFQQYAAYYASPGSLSWLFFVGMDYHYGPFSSRNMMEEIRIRDLSGKTLAIDGDLLIYDDKDRPSLKSSNTLDAAAAVFPNTPKQQIFKAFILEKDPQYIYTDVHRAIVQAHKERFGETPFAVIGELWMGESAQIKHGTTWKTRAYLNKLDRYLNSIPWDV